MAFQNDTTSEKIIHISSFPPPVGGKSVFLQRLKYYTDRAAEKRICYVDVSGCDTAEKEKNGIRCLRKQAVPLFLLKEKPACIVFHSNSAFHLVLNRLFMHKHMFIYFAHGESILKEKNRKGWRHGILSKAECIVCPTDAIYLGVKEIFPQMRVEKIPFVILPGSVRPLDDPRVEQLRQRVKFVFSSYAYSFLEHEGVSLYGVDMLIEALHKLRKDGYDCGLVLLVSDASDKKKYQGYMARIEELGLHEYFTVLDHPIDEACRLYVSTDAYLRPTNTDANAFSIYEALHMGTPVLASDAVPRPEGCLTFRNRDIAGFAEKMEDLVDRYKEIKAAVQKLEITGYEQELLAFFSGIGN